MCLTFADMLMRSVFNAPIEAATELIRIEIALLVFASLPVLSATNAHIAVDLLDGPFRKFHRERWRDAAVALICAVILWYPAGRIVDLAEHARSYGDVTDYLAISTFYIAYFIAAMTYITSLALLGRGLLHLFARKCWSLNVIESLIGFVAVFVLVLLRIPIAFAMGLFVNKGGISRERYTVSNAFLGHFRGGWCLGHSHSTVGNPVKWLTGHTILAVGGAHHRARVPASGPAGPRASWGERLNALSHAWAALWFGIVVIVVIVISRITPPVGLNVFILNGVVRDVATVTVFRGVTPF